MEIGAWLQKQYFTPVKARQFQPQTCQKNTLVHFSFHYNKSFVKYLSFLKKLATCRFLLESHLLDSATLNLPEKHTGSLFSPLQLLCSSVCPFWKKGHCLPLLAGKSSEKTVPSNLGNNSWADNSHRTLSPDLFSHGMVRCVLGLSLHRSETAVKQVFVNLEIQTWR